MIILSLHDSADRSKSIVASPSEFRDIHENNVADHFRTTTTDVPRERRASRIQDA